MSTAYTHGLHQLADGVHAYLQPKGEWGRSNAGLIHGTDSALLVDTLFDAPLTKTMLETLRPLTEQSPIEVVVNTHGDGDHWFGNYELPSTVDIIAAEAAKDEMRTMTPETLANLVQGELEPPLRDFARRVFGAFDFASSNPRMPSETFRGRMSLTVGGRAVELIEVGPAHTAGDVLVYVPESSAVFTGDILFIGSTPIVWHGPVNNWLAACGRILALGAEHIVPGHGPLTDRGGVFDVRRYLEYVRAQARQRFDAGMGAIEAADDIELGEFSGWHAAERIVVNVERCYQEFDPARPPSDKITLFEGMAHYATRRQVG